VTCSLQLGKLMAAGGIALRRALDTKRLSRTAM
jgi:hypothetical protein